MKLITSNKSEFIAYSSLLRPFFAHILIMKYITHKGNIITNWIEKNIFFRTGLYSDSPDLYNNSLRSLLSGKDPDLGVIIIISTEVAPAHKPQAIGVYTYCHQGRSSRLIDAICKSAYPRSRRPGELNSTNCNLSHAPVQLISCLWIFCYLRASNEVKYTKFRYDIAISIPGSYRDHNCT